MLPLSLPSPVDEKTEDDNEEIGALPMASRQRAPQVWQMELEPDRIIAPAVAGTSRLSD